MEKYYQVKIKKFDDNHIQVKVYSYWNKYDIEVNEKDKKAFEDDFTGQKSLDEDIADAKRSIKVSKNRAINKIYDYARSNEWEYFITLTFDPKKVDSYDYDICSKCVYDWIRNIKKRYSPDLQYIIVPELHKSGRYHFHALFQNIGNLPLEDSGKTDSQGFPIYNIKCYTLGFTTASRIKSKDKASSYIAKYISKELSGHIKGKKHYWTSRGLNLPTEDRLTLNELVNLGLNRNNLTDFSTFNKVVEYDFGSLHRKIEYYEIDLRQVKASPVL